MLFRLGSLACAAPATAVREVIPAGRPVRIPGAPDTVAGLVNLRGVLLTVVDGRRAIGVDGGNGDPESILVLEQGTRIAGFAVDEVLDLIEAESGGLAAGEALPGVDRRMVQAVGRHDGRAYAVLDTQALVRPVLG